MRSIPFRNLALLGAGLISVSTGSAVGQDALGSGGALDANLGVGGRANSAAPREDYRARNSLITNNVAGGRGFRGSVGYSAPDDFRGVLGANDLYRFRADSAYSAPELFSLGTTYQQLRFGQGLGALEVHRAGEGASGFSIQPSPSGLDLPASRSGPARLGAGNEFDSRQLQQLQQLDRSMATTSSYSMQVAAEPRVVGMTRTQENVPILFNASPLRGLSLERADQDLGLLGLTSLDEARLRADIEQGRPQTMIGQPFETRFEQNATDGTAIDTSSPSARVEPPGQSPEADPQADAKGYPGILSSVTERYQQQINKPGEVGQGGVQNSEQPMGEQLQRDYQALRQRLHGGIRSAVGDPGRQPGQDSPSPDEADPLRHSSEDPAGVPGQELTRPQSPDVTDSLRLPELPSSPGGIRNEQRPGMGDPVAPKPPIDPTTPKAPSADPASDERESMTLEQYGVILQHGQRLETLSTKDQGRFNELMSSAQEKLSQGEYFWAERRFERALRFTPGHPLATAGSAHAQIGAGLYLSASFTLRNLFTNQPEMIDVTYADAILPAKSRLDESIKALESKLAEGSNVETADRAGYAFLLAYLGHQIGDESRIKAGLDELERVQSSDTLGKLLRRVWLEGGSAGPEPGK